MVWVWGEGGARAFIDSAAQAPACAPELAPTPDVRTAAGGEVLYTAPPYLRDFPYGAGRSLPLTAPFAGLQRVSACSNDGKTESGEVQAFPSCASKLARLIEEE
jgi:hypothetical protein